MNAYVYIPELDLEVEFEGEIVQHGFKCPGDSETPPYEEANGWRVWWNTNEYTAEQNSIIELYREEAENELEEKYKNQYCED